MNQFNVLHGAEDAEDETEDETGTEEEEAHEWFCTEAEANEVVETDEVVVEEHTNAVACAISFFFSVVFAVTMFIFLVSFWHFFLLLLLLITSTSPPLPAKPATGLVASWLVGAELDPGEGAVAAST